MDNDLRYGLSLGIPGLVRGRILVHFSDTVDCQNTVLNAPIDHLTAVAGDGRPLGHFNHGAIDASADII